MYSTDCSAREKKDLKHTLSSVPDFIIKKKSERPKKKTLITEGVNPARFQNANNKKNNKQQKN